MNIQIDALLFVSCLVNLGALILIYLAVRRRGGNQIDTVAREEFRLIREESGRTSRELRKS
jgi:hypothetical protein